MHSTFILTPASVYFVFKTNCEQFELLLSFLFLVKSKLIIVRYHRYAQRVLSNVSQDFDSNFSTKNIAFCAVDLDETPELSTYTHYNSIDIMAFYPHLMINGIRFDGKICSHTFCVL